MAICPICKRHPSEPKYQPFCSSRCADVDLGRWFTGAYVIPVREDEPTDDGAGLGGGPDRTWRED
jgi:endogenous inhibitor of DNA gyrase (YacG/DUF329 family)